MMGFELIDNTQAIPAGGVPKGGVLVSARRLGARSGGTTRFIKVQIGEALAKKLALTGSQIVLAIAFGNGRDAGMIRLGADHSSGTFSARLLKSGGYSMTINAATAAGLFAMEFAPFAIEDIEPDYVKGTAPTITFKASDAMLAVDD